MNRYLITYHTKNPHILEQDKVNARTMQQALKKFNLIRRGIEPKTCSLIGKLEECHAPQTKEYINLTIKV